LLKYFFITTLLIFVLRLIFKNFSIAVLATFLTLCLFFFFGAIHDFLKSIFSKGLLSRYVVVLPFLLLVYFLLLLEIRRRFIKPKIIRYLNILFAVLILFDIGILIFKKANGLNNPVDIVLDCKQCEKPDVYLILLDGYAGQAQLNSEFDFDNSLFYKELRQSGFYVSPDSRSNYTSTAFSVSSILSMAYHNLKNYKTTPESLDYCFKKIYNSTVVNSFKSTGYEFYNFSIFDFKNQPSLINKTFLISGKKLITSQTLLSRMEKDLYYNFLMNNFTHSGLYKNFVFRDLKNNKLLMNKTLKTARQNNEKPKFVYLHLMLPHFPYYYNQQGILNNINDLKYDKLERKDLYLNYLKYGNNIILNLIQEIKLKSEKPPVVILLSDHGFRYGSNKDYKLRFSNLAAIHLPNKKYLDYENTLTNVNVFRIFFNSYFRQNLPMLENKIVD